LLKAIVEEVLSLDLLRCNLVLKTVDLVETTKRLSKEVGMVSLRTGSLLEIKLRDFGFPAGPGTRFQTGFPTRFQTGLGTRFQTRLNTHTRLGTLCFFGDLVFFVNLGAAEGCQVGHLAGLAISKLL